MVSSIFALLSSEEQTNAIIRDITNDGIPLASISVVIPKFSRDSGSLSWAGWEGKADAAARRTTREILDGGLGWLVGIDMVPADDDSPFLVVGLSLAGLAGPTFKSTGGSTAGALVSLGMPEYVARRFDGRIRGGSILLSILISDRNWIGQARRILAEHDADEICYAGEVRGVQGGSSAGLAETSNSARLRRALRPRSGNAAESEFQPVQSANREGVSPASR